MEKISICAAPRAFGFLIGGAPDPETESLLESAATIGAVSLTIDQLNGLARLAYMALDVAADMADESLADLRPVAELYCVCIEAAARAYATQPAAMHPDQV